MAAMGWAQRIAVLATLGVIGLPAWGWEPGAARLVPLSVQASEILVVDGRVVLGGSAGVYVLAPKTFAVAAHLEGGGQSLIATDLDGDGAEDLVLCSSHGLAWHRGIPEGFEERSELDDEPCERVVPLSGGLVTAGARVHHWTWEGDKVTGTRFDLGQEGPYLLASEGERYVAVAAEGTQIVEHSAFGRSTYTARAPVSGLVSGPRSWLWSLVGEPVMEDVRRQTLALSDLPAGALTEDIDGDGERELLVRYERAVGLFYGEGERVIPSTHELLGVAVGDADGDGCTDLVLLGSTELTLRPGLCEKESWQVVGAVSREVILHPPEQVLEVFVGERVSLRLVDPESEHSRFAIADAPASLVMSEDGMGQLSPTTSDIGQYVVIVRMWGGEDIVRMVSLRLVVRGAGERASAGANLPHLLVGGAWPTVRLGVRETLAVRLKVPGSERASFALRDGPEGMVVTEKGLLTYFPAPDDVGEWQVELKVRGAVSNQAGFRMQVKPSSTGVAIANVAQVHGGDRTKGFWSTQHCLLSLGVAGGITDATATWQDDEDTVFLSLSPALAGLCEGGSPDHGLRWFVGGETAPLFAYLLSEDNLGVHTLVGTAGFGYGTDRFLIGPYVSMGILMSGFGLRTAWLPFENRKGRRHGLEVRGTYIIASNLAFEGMVLYGFRFGG